MTIKKKHENKLKVFNIMKVMYEKAIKVDNDPNLNVDEQKYDINIEKSNET